MISRKDILFAPLQSQENGTPYEVNFSDTDVRLFEKIYFECNVKSLFEQVLREAENNIDVNNLHLFD
jgi:hypothetical protein